MYKQLREAGAGGAGGGGGGTGAGGVGGAPTIPAFDPAIHAPEDIRNEPMLANVKTIHDLTKGYVSAQRLVGSKRIALPAADAPDSAWESFYSEIGRPGTPDQYTDLPPEEVKLPEGLNIDKAKMDEAKKMMHSMGLTPKQFRGIMKYYLERTANEFTGQQSAREMSSTQAMTELKTSWGDKFGANIDVAKSVIKKFGDESLGAFLEESQLGNNVPLVKFLNKIGMAMLEDKQRGGTGGDFQLTDATKAINEIEALKLDPEFQKAYMNASHPGHQAAMNRMTNLFKIAHPGKQEN